MKLPRSNDELVAYMKKHSMVKTPAIIEAFRAVDRGDFATPNLGQVTWSVFFSFLFVFEMMFFKVVPVDFVRLQHLAAANVSPRLSRISFFPTLCLAEEMPRIASPRFC